MLEVLISIVVLAFGMLGVAGLQAFALKNGQGASLRSVATVLATDIIDRIRVNPEGVISGAYANASGPGTATQFSACLTGAGCGGPTNLAQNDLFEWKASVAAALPKGEATVCIDSSPNDGTSPASHGCDGIGPYVIKIWWLDDRNAKAATTPLLKLFSTEFQL